MKKLLISLLAVLFLLPIVAQHCGSCSSSMEAKNTTVSAPEAKKVIPGPKKSIWIDSEHYVTYEWNKSPKIGTYILLVSVFNKDKNRVSNLNVTADAYMPSMKGSHDTGDQPMKLNKKNQYAIPVYFMMLGDWEIGLKFHKNNRLLGDAYVQLMIK